MRVCEVLLSLTSTLIDLGVLANKTKALLLSSLVNPDNKPTTSNNEEASSAPNDKEKSPENTEQLSLHNTFMDIVIRQVKSVSLSFHAVCSIRREKSRRETLRDVQSLARKFDNTFHLLLYSPYGSILLKKGRENPSTAPGDTQGHIP